MRAEFDLEVAARLDWGRLAILAITGCSGGGVMLNLSDDELYGVDRRKCTSGKSNNDAPVECVLM